MLHAHNGLAAGVIVTDSAAEILEMPSASERPTRQTCKTKTDGVIRGKRNWGARKQCQLASRAISYPCSSLANVKRHPQEIYERLCTEYLKKSLPRLRELAPAARAPPTERIQLLDTRNSMEMLSLVLQLFRQRHQDGLRILVDGTSRLRVF